jgi:hypothetical protein
MDLTNWADANCANFRELLGVTTLTGIAGRLQAGASKRLNAKLYRWRKARESSDDASETMAKTLT